MFHQIDAQSPAVNACALLNRFEFKPESNPFSCARIKAAARDTHSQVELGALRAELQSMEMAVVELFSVLCKHSPELLPPAWSVLYDLIAAEERFWIFPKVTLGDMEDGLGDVFTPYLDTHKLAQEWPALVLHADNVSAAQRSGRELALPA